jgi:hypothetical protein
VGARDTLRIVCVFFALLFLLLCGYLLVAFLTKFAAAAALAAPHLGVCRHREYRDYHCDREGSHFGHHNRKRLELTLKSRRNPPMQASINIALDSY